MVMNGGWFIIALGFTKRLELSKQLQRRSLNALGDWGTRIVPSLVSGDFRGSGQTFDDPDCFLPLLSTSFPGSLG